MDDDEVLELLYDIKRAIKRGDADKAMSLIDDVRDELDDDIDVDEDDEDEDEDEDDEDEAKEEGEGAEA